MSVKVGPPNQLVHMMNSGKILVVSLTESHPSVCLCVWLVAKPPDRFVMIQLWKDECGHFFLSLVHGLFQVLSHVLYF